MSQIQKTHLERAAYIYVRQSSLTQVQHNVQSQRCQYGLTEHARQLGFADVRVIDDDQDQGILASWGHPEFLGE